MSLSKKWEDEKNPLQPVKNSSLVCRYCQNAIDGRTVDCKAYATKPVSVLKGGPCNEFKEKE